MLCPPKDFATSKETYIRWMEVWAHSPRTQHPAGTMHHNGTVNLRNVLTSLDCSPVEGGEDRRANKVCASYIRCL